MVRIHAWEHMCGMGKCQICGDISYEIGPLGGIGSCFTDVEGVMSHITDITDKKKELSTLKRLISSPNVKFFIKHMKHSGYTNLKDYFYSKR